MNTNTDANTADLADRIRDFLAANWRSDPNKPMVERLHGKPMRDWIRLLWKAGLRAPGWPKEHGGMGLGLEEQLVYHHLMDRYGAPRFVDLGVHLLGPVLMAYGTDAQKQTYLPRILSGEDIWCQGYSEPDAGSDLASLRTSATVSADSVTIRGQKTWTTQASYADKIFLLARSSQETKRQAGISFILCDVDAPGVTVRPLSTLSGEVEFAEVFFDDVTVPRDRIVGEVGAGWTVAKALLSFERLSIGSPTQAAQAFRVLVQLMRQSMLAPGVSREAIDALSCDLHDLRCFFERVSRAMIDGRDVAIECSMLKVAASRLFQRIAREYTRISGERAAIVGEQTIGSTVVDLHHAYMLSRPTSIYSGTNEIQLNVIARGLFD